MCPLLYTNTNLGDSDEWHADETVVKINAQKYYLWICIDSETRFITSWNLNKSREAECAFSLFKQTKRFGKPKSIWSYVNILDTKSQTFHAALLANNSH